MNDSIKQLADHAERLKESGAIPDLQQNPDFTSSDSFLEHERWKHEGGGRVVVEELRQQLEQLRKDAAESARKTFFLSIVSGAIAGVLASWLSHRFFGF